MRRILVAMPLLMLALPALARVGGGQGYSSSSSSGGGGYSGSYHGGGYSSGSGSYSSSGSSSDDQLIGFLLELIIRLLIAYPQIGFPLLIGGGIAYWIYNRAQAPARAQLQEIHDWSRSRPERSRLPRDPQPPNLERLKAADPNFSRPLFLDFLNLLYVKAQTLRNEELDAIGACLSETARRQLARDSGWSRVIIGALTVRQVDLSSQRQRVVVGVEANLERESAASYVVDRMVLERQAGTLTPTPEIVTSFACPKCGSKAPVKSGVCASCQSKVNEGNFSWLLVELVRERSQPRVEVALDSSGQEVGTELPTVYDPGLQTNLEILRGQDPSFSAQALEQHAERTFLALQQAWSEGRWEKARPLESDYLFGQHQLWMEAYEREGLRNLLEDVRVLRIELVRLELDRYFESATLRVFASMKDSTVRIDDGALVSGNPRAARTFSEYWTFIRRSGVTSKTRELTCCPNCGALLDRISVTGVCEYCDANITRGDFDWILSRIEQDEAYSAS